MPTRPEYTFQCQSQILTARFCPFHPNLIAGGTYTGQILLWDLRAKSQPVLKTPLSSMGHTYPVYCLNFVGNQSSNSLVTMSSDGQLCSWALDLLAQPQERLDLSQSVPKTLRAEEVSVTGFAFLPNDTNSFVVGCEDGSILPAFRADRAGWSVMVASA